MTSATQTEAISKLDRMFESHPSLSASLEDFEQNEKNSPMIRLPSQHSGFRDDSSEPGNDSTSEGPWSPPGWKGAGSSNGWYRHQPYLRESPLVKFSRADSGTHSRDRASRSPAFDDDDPTLPMNIPLPRGSMSPEKGFSASPAPEQARMKKEASERIRSEDTIKEEGEPSEEKKDNCTEQQLPVSTSANRPRHPLRPPR